MFDQGAKSCFLDFIEGAETRLVELLGEAKELSDSNLLGEYLRDSLEDGRINCGRPASACLYGCGGGIKQQTHEVGEKSSIQNLLTSLLPHAFAARCSLLCFSSPLPLFFSASLLSLCLFILSLLPSHQGPV